MLMNASAADRLAFVSTIQHSEPFTRGHIVTQSGQSGKQAELKRTLPAIHTAYLLQERESSGQA